MNKHELSEREEDKDKRSDGEESRGKDKEDKGEVKKGSDIMLYAAIGIIIISILVILGFKYFYNPEPKTETYLYNGFEFRKLGDLWYVNVQPQGGQNLFKVPLHFGPKDVANISVVGNIDQEKFNQQEIYLTFDPDSKQDLKFVALSSAELSLSMAQALGAIPIAACSKNESEACFDRPIKDCSADEPVIYFKDSEQPRVTLNGACVLVEGRGYDLVRATDRLLLWWYDIMTER